MKACRLIVLLIPVLFACIPKQPEVPLMDVPAGPLLQALEQRQQSFKGLKAVASITISKLIGKRTLDTVGIALDGQRRFRMEAYGPLGQSMMVLVWNGSIVLLQAPDSDDVMRQGQAGLDQFLGEGLDAKELCALLSGNIPEPIQPSEAVQRCAQNNSCVLEVRRNDSLRRVQIVSSSSRPEEEPVLASQELHRFGKVIYRAVFDRWELVSHYSLPMKIEIEIPERNLRMKIEYSDVEVNTTVPEEAFTLSDVQR